MSPLVVFEDVFPVYTSASNPSIEDIRNWEVDYWVDIMIDCVPAYSRRPLRRWFCEVHARRSIWPPSQNPEAVEHIWTHYYSQDFYARSLRQAYLTANKVGDRLWDRLLDDPSFRP